MDSNSKWFSLVNGLVTREDDTKYKALRIASMYIPSSPNLRLATPVFDAEFSERLDRAGRLRNAHSGQLFRELDLAWEDAIRTGVTDEYSGVMWYVSPTGILSVAALNGHVELIKRVSYAWINRTFAEQTEMSIQDALRLVRCAMHGRHFDLVKHFVMHPMIKEDLQAYFYPRFSEWHRVESSAFWTEVAGYGIDCVRWLFDNCNEMKLRVNTDSIAYKVAELGDVVSLEYLMGKGVTFTQDVVDNAMEHPSLRDWVLEHADVEIITYEYQPTRNDPDYIIEEFDVIMTIGEYLHNVAFPVD